MIRNNKQTTWRLLALVVLLLVAYSGQASQAQDRLSATATVFADRLTINFLFLGSVEVAGRQRPWTEALVAPFRLAAEQWLGVVRGIQNKEHHTLSIYVEAQAFEDDLVTHELFYDTLEAFEGRFFPTEGSLLINTFAYSPEFAQEFTSAEERDFFIKVSILHQMGHLLGIGSLWNLSLINGEVVPDDEQPNLRNWVEWDDETNGPVYREEAGVFQYNQVFDTEFDLLPIGNDFQHLYDFVNRDYPARFNQDGQLLPPMTDELMADGYVLSAITAGLLEDLGWDVDAEFVDDYMPAQAN